MNYSIQVTDNVLSIIPSGVLDMNKQYNVTLSAGLSGYYGDTDLELSSDYTFWFTSQYCPLYTTVGRVKLEAGPYADSFTDDTIYRMIHKNSQDAIDLYNLSYGTRHPYTYWGCVMSSVPITLRRYVECKTAYDLLSIVKLSASGGPGGSSNQTKHLGDMTIKYGGQTSSGAGDPERLKDLYECWQQMRRMIRSMRVAVKGYYDESKGFAHPARFADHNRVIRPVIKGSRDLPGVSQHNGYNWRGF